MSKIIFEPNQDRLLVQRCNDVEDDFYDEDKLIAKPDQSKERPREGIILFKGRGRILIDGTRLPIDFSVGDRVLFNKHAGTEVKVGRQQFLILREDDILGKVSVLEAENIPNHQEIEPAVEETFQEQKTLPLVLAPMAALPKKFFDKEGSIEFNEKNDFGADIIAGYGVSEQAQDPQEPPPDDDVEEEPDSDAPATLEEPPAIDAPAVEEPVEKPDYSTDNPDNDPLSAKLESGISTIEEQNKALAELASATEESLETTNELVETSSR